MQNEKAQLVSSRAFFAGPFRLLEMIDQNFRLARLHLKRQQRNARRQTLPWREFLKELLRAPRTVGAVCPSSRHLASAMAEAVDFAEGRLVVELGAGTGSITQALLRRGVPASQLIVIERSEVLARRLKKRFPMLTVIQGDAAELPALLSGRAQDIGSVVSSLPLRSLDPATSDAIIAGILDTLGDGGRLIQFTYDLRKPSIPERLGLRRNRTRWVWANLPPARVDVFDYQVTRGSHETTKAAY